jgi:hypothetical protein
MQTYPKALPLFAELVSAGKLPGIKLHSMAPDDIAALQLPVVYCQGEQCGTQLVTDWFVVDPYSDRPRWLCLFCAQDIAFHEPGTVHPLIEGGDAWLSHARCRHQPSPWDGLLVGGSNNNH